MTQVGIQYGQALYDLAASQCLTEEILQQMQTLNQSFSQEPAFLRLLGTPNLSKEERCAVLDKSFRGQVHPYVLNFLKILTQKGYARYFSDCCKTYEDQYNMEHGILPVEAVTAVSLTQAQEERLIQKIQSITGKTVALSQRVDPACLGGVRLHYDGKQVDGTVKNRLDTMGNLLRKTVL